MRPELWTRKLVVGSEQCCCCRLRPGKPIIFPIHTHLSLAHHVCIDCNNQNNDTAQRLGRCCGGWHGPCRSQQSFPATATSTTTDDHHRSHALVTPASVCLVAFHVHERQYVGTIRPTLAGHESARPILGWIHRCLGTVFDAGCPQGQTILRW